MPPPGQPTPVEADPSGNDFFCFQKRVVKGAEFLNLEHPDCGDPTERGDAEYRICTTSGSTAAT